LGVKSTQILEEIYERLHRHYGPRLPVAESFDEKVAAAIPTKKLAEIFLLFLKEKYGGNLSRMASEPAAKLRSELLGLKGIGPGTADAILLRVLGQAVFAIDVHAYRVFTRHALAAEESGYEELQEIAGAFPVDLERYREFHALLVRVGQEFCRTKAKCEECPLKGVNW
jgi:endonuclease-3 related protein